MGISLQHEHRTIFVPPVSLPMRMNLPNGQFGIDRHFEVHQLTERLVEQFGNRILSEEEFQLPSNKRLRAHYGLDLLGQKGSPIFASKRGTITEIKSMGSTNEFRVTIRHVEHGGQGFITRYVHIKNVIPRINTSVSQGECIGFIHNDHLHFEIHLILNSQNIRDWHRINSVPIDPLPYLYRWEEIYYNLIKKDEDSTYLRPKLEEWGEIIHFSVIQRNGLPWCEINHNTPDAWYRIPLLDSGIKNTHLIDLLKNAFYSSKMVRLTTRVSPFFFGDTQDNPQKIITEARVKKV